MAAIEKRIRYKADVSEVYKALGKVQAAQKKVAAEAGSLHAAFVKGAKEGGKKAASKLIAEYKAEFRKRQGALKESLARGLIGRKAFNVEMGKLKRDFNRGIISAQKELRTQGRLTVKDNRALQRSLFTIGKASGQAGKKVDQVKKEVKQLGSEAERTGTKSKGLRQSLLSVRAVLGTLGVGALVAGFRQLTRAISEFEQFEARLTTVERSAYGAAKALATLQDLAVETPYELSQLTRAYTLLRAAGIKPTADEMRGLGNIAATFGRDITDIATAAISREREVFKRWGIDLRTAGDELTINGKRMENTISNVVAALQELGETQFEGGMIRQMDTIAGRTSNLRDELTLLAKAIGEGGLGDAINRFLSGLVTIARGQRETQELQNLVQMAGRAGDAILSQEGGEQARAQLRAHLAELRDPAPHLRNAFEIRKTEEALAAVEERLGSITRNSALFGDQLAESAERAAIEIAKIPEALAPIDIEVGPLDDFIDDAMHAEQILRDTMLLGKAGDTAAHREYTRMKLGIREIVEEVEEVEEAWSEVSDFVAGAAKGLLSVLDATGKLNSDTRRILRGVIDIGEAWDRVRKLQAGGNLFSAGGLGAIAAGVGGLVSVIGGVFGGGERDRHEKEQIRAMERLRASLDDLRDAVQPNVRPQELRAQVEAARAVARTHHPLADQVPLQKALKPLLDALMEAGIIGSPDDILEGGVNRAELEFVLDAAEQLAGDAGVFAEDLKGQLDALNYRFGTLADGAASAADMMEDFIQVIGQFSPAAAQALRAMSAEDQRKQLREWGEALVAGGPVLETVLAALGISASELQALVDNGLRVLDGTAGGGASRGVQVARSITEIQANEVVAWLEAIAFTLRSILTVMTGGEAQAAVAAAGAALPSAVLSGAGTPAAVAGQSMTTVGGSLNVERVDVRTQMDAQTFRSFWAEAGEEVLRRGGSPDSGFGF